MRLFIAYFHTVNATWIEAIHGLIVIANYFKCVYGKFTSFKSKKIEDSSTKITISEAQLT